MANLTNYFTNKNLNLDQTLKSLDNSQNNNYTSNSIETYSLESEIVNKQIQYNNDGGKTETYTKDGQTFKDTISYSPGQITKTTEVTDESGFVRKNSFVYSSKDGKLIKNIVYDKDGGKRVIDFFSTTYSTDLLGTDRVQENYYDANGNLLNGKLVGFGPKGGKTTTNSVVITDFSYSKNKNGEIVHISRDYGDNGGNGGKDAIVCESIEDANGKVSKRTHYSMVDGKNDYSNRYEETYNADQKATKIVGYENDKIVTSTEYSTDSAGNTVVTNKTYNGGFGKNAVMTEGQKKYQNNDTFVHIYSTTQDSVTGNPIGSIEYEMVDGKGIAGSTTIRYYNESGDVTSVISIDENGKPEVHDFGYLYKNK